MQGRLPDEVLAVGVTRAQAPSRGHVFAHAFTVRGWEVVHLGAGGQPAIHELPAFAVVSSGGRLS